MRKMRGAKASRIRETALVRYLHQRFPGGNATDAGQMEDRQPGSHLANSPTSQQRLRPPGSEFDQLRENAYFGAPFSDALAARKKSMFDKSVAVPQGGLF